MRRTFIQLAVVSTALAVIAPAVAAPRATPVRTSAPLPKAAPATESTPAAAQTEGLCGLTQADVVDIVDHYDLAPKWWAYAEALEVPLNCDAYGELCSAVGPAATETYACGVWLGLEAHVSLAEIRESANQWIDDNTTECTPNEAVCEDVCEEMPILDCFGIMFGGHCRTIAACDPDMIGIRFVEALAEAIQRM
jgi:hypothetical protein